MSFIKSFAVVVFAASLVAPVFAQNSDTTPVITKDSVSRDILRRIERGRARAVEQLAEEMLELSPDGEVTEESVQNYVAIQRAHYFANEMEQYLRHDLDQDGALSKQEVSRFRQIMRRDDRANLALTLVRWDLNGDGALEWEELRAASVKAVEEVQKRKSSLSGDRARQFLVFDLNQDGVATIAEMVEAVNILHTCDC